MNKKLWFLFFSLIGMFVVQPCLRGSELNQSNQVEYLNDRLTVNVDKVTLGSLLKAIRQKTGIEFEVGQEQSQELVSLQFTSLPLEEGLKRVLNRFNAVMLLNSESRVTKVIILAGTGDGSSPKRPGVGHSIAAGSTGSQTSPGSTPLQPTGVAPTTGAEISAPRPFQSNIPKAPSEAPAIQPPSAQMVVQPPAATMDVRPTTERMTVMPPTQTMTIQLPNGETKTVTGNE
jgi:hypothetical protein